MRTKKIYIGCDKYLKNDYFSASTNFETVNCHDRVIEIEVPIGIEEAEIVNDIEIKRETYNKKPNQG